MGTRTHLFAAVLLLAAVPASARPAGPSKKQEQLLDHKSGFLGENYARLKPDPHDPDWLVYFSSRDVLRHAHTFHVDKVRVFLVPEAQQRDIDPADLEKLAEYFHHAIVDQLSAGDYKVVSEPGPGVITLRFAITNVEPNGGKTNMAMAGAEAVAAHAIVPVPGASELIPRLKVGKVSIEGEMVDSESGETEMAFMTAKSGRRFFSGTRAFRKWADIDAAFRGWAKNFRKRLDKAHGV